MANCPWSDVMLSVAWSVWHNQKLFEEMNTVITCPLPSGLKHKKPNDWWNWLASAGDDRTSYNVHEVWIWYNKHVIKGVRGGFQLGKGV